MNDINDIIEQSFRQGLLEGRKATSNNMKYPEGLKEIAEYYGFSSQADMLIEESAEFTQALNKLRRGKAEAYKNIKEEVADVLVVALQLRLILGEHDIDHIIESKIKRQLERIEDEKTN